MLGFWLTLIGFLADQAWNLAEYRQNEKHHREAIEAAAGQAQRSSSPELDALLRKILETPPQTPEPRNAATPDPAPLPAKGPQVLGSTHSRTVFRDETIEGVIIVLDGKSFSGCTFRDCRLVFTGEGGGLLEHCVFSEGTEWAFDGPASQVLSSLEATYHGSTQGKRFVESIFDTIRRRDFGTGAKRDFNIAAWRTLRFIQAMYHGATGADRLVENIFEKIRKAEWTG
jgi:hypothetical protein